MTAEIALMNKKAIALATDSAVTIGNTGKKYNSENKLFMLSKYCPIGIMIYSNAEFMGVPWETIIKCYRTKLDSKKFNSLEEYANDFVNFIKYGYIDFEFAENLYLQNILTNYIECLNKEITLICKSKSDNLRKTLDENEIKDIVYDKIDNLYSIFNTYERIPDFTSKCEEYITSQCRLFVPRILNSCNNFRIENYDLEKLNKLCVQVFIKDYFNIYSGIVIAGFGEQDIFPSLISYKFSGKIKGCVKYKIDKSDKITLNKDYGIVPFAQDDVVMTFLQGIDNGYMKVIKDFYNEIINTSITNLSNELLSEDKKNYLAQYLNLSWETLANRISYYSNVNYVQPIIQAIRVSPKDELASMAEALVNVTSFKRNVVMDDNLGTVGGPIDIAIISKGDGFVWVKRKHYFKSEYNHQFFENYYNKKEER